MATYKFIAYEGKCNGEYGIKKEDGSVLSYEVGHILSEDE